MVTGSVLVKQLIVERVRQPREWMPVSLLLGSKSPGDCVPAQALVDVRIFGDVAVVVIIDEGVAIDRVVERQGSRHQQEAQNYVALFG